MANRVWVVLQHRDGQLPRISWEAAAAAQKLAAGLGGKAEAVLLGSGVGLAAADVAKLDLAAVHVADSDALRTYTPGATIGALAPAIRAAKPAFVVFPHTYQTVDFMARLAQTAGAGLLPEVTGFESGEGGLVWTRPVMGGKLQSKVRVKGEGTVLVSVQSGAFPADGVVRGEAEVKPLDVDLSGVRPDREILGYEEVGGDTVDLSKAEVIVAVSGIEEVSNETRLLYCSSTFVSPTRRAAVVLSVELPPPPMLPVSPLSQSRPSSAATE